MKFAVKFVNGYWTLFDTEAFEPVHLYGLEADAREDCDRVNLARTNKQRTR